MRISVLSLIVAMMLAGCAGSATTQTPLRAADSAVTTPAPLDNLDYAKMAAIEREATARGVKVIWVNPPTLDD